jgi:hypothetical protein
MWAVSPSSGQLKLRSEEVDGLRHDGLQDEFTGAHVADKVLEAEEVEVFGAADDDVAVG